MLWARSGLIDAEKRVATASSRGSGATASVDRWAFSGEKLYWGMGTNSDLRPATGLRRRVRWGIMILFPLLFIQFALVLNRGEFYPAVLQPLFGGVDGEAGIYRTVEMDIRFHFGDRDTTFSQNEFLSDMTESYRYHVMERLMGPDAPPEVYQDAGFRDWLLRRCERLTTRPDPQRFSVTWNQIALDLRGDSLQSSRQLAGIFSYRF